MVSEAAEAMKAVVESAAPTLTSAGFKKRRNAFNRSSEAGVIQVVGFQMDPPDRRAGKSPDPASRTFTVNLGVFVADGADRAEPMPTWVSPADCQLRQTVSELVPPGPDAHLALDDVDRATWATFHVLTMYALPWLDERRTPIQIAAFRPPS